MTVIKVKLSVAARVFWLSVDGPLHFHPLLNAVRIQQLANCKNTLDRKSCCLRESVYIETDQWTVLQNQLRGKKQLWKVWSSRINWTTKCSLRMKELTCHVISRTNRLEGPVTVWSHLKIHKCFGAAVLQFNFGFASWEFSTVCTSPWKIDSLTHSSGCIAIWLSRAMWEDGGNIKTGV